MSDKEKVILTATKVVNDIISIRQQSTDEVKAKLYSILEDSKEIFEIIGEYQKEFIKDAVRGMEFYYEALDKLTGCYFYLSPIVSVLDALEKNRSLVYYHNEKITIEKAGSKFVSSSTEKESDYYVNEERYVLAIFEGMLEACRTGIQTCRARVRDVKEEEGLN